MFKICARTVLELGAELISSDVIAFYELIKNAFDAGSPIGAEIRFEICMRRNDYLAHRQQVENAIIDLVSLKQQIGHTLDNSAPADSLARFKQSIESAQSYAALIQALDNAYATENRIVVSDEGSGMSYDDLTRNYLVIGTASRKKAIDEALTRSGHAKGRPPFLGEKGIGRLSAMRLGDTLTVETARKEDKLLNILQIDWSAFTNVDTMLEDIEVAPFLGGVKPEDEWCGTRLVMGRLTADWTKERVRHIADYDFARLTDPFSSNKQRPRIAVFWNGERIPVATMDPNLLDQAHASITGRYYFDDGTPMLECVFTAFNLGFEHPKEVERCRYALPDLHGSISGTSVEIPLLALTSLGEFSFEAYWFNRRRLSAIDSIGDQETVRKLQRKWAGILLYRDGFRVLPYGDDEDDWLALDRKAFAQTSYLLNKTQFVGRVNISRLGNPALVDQTNREGLRVCSEQQAFIGLLQLTIQSQLGGFLRDVQKRYKGQPLDMGEAKPDITELEKRTKSALSRIRKTAPEASEVIEELQHLFFEIKEYFERAQNRITEVENENRQMVQMAGVGLLVEVVAHELARSTENALSALEALKGHHIPEKINGLVEALRAEMKAVNKRVRVLDPLSISGRQRREVFDLVSLIVDVLSGHSAQFKRHNISLKLNKPNNPVRVRAVKGMMVQIIENLVSNSIYWLDLRKEREHGFKPLITISISANPLSVTYEDNGTGIAKENRDKVFRAFFSLREIKKRRGLGLFIARECAEYENGTLTLDEHVNPETGRLHRFVLELPNQAEVP